MKLVKFQVIVSVAAVEVETDEEPDGEKPAQLRREMVFLPPVLDIAHIDLNTFARDAVDTLRKVLGDRDGRDLGL